MSDLTSPPHPLGRDPERDANGAGAHRPGGGVARGPIVLAILAVLVVAGLVDRQGGPRAAAASPIQPVPVAAPASALSSSWFCAGATDTAKGAAPGRVVITNGSARRLSATVTLVPSQGTRVVVTLAVGPRDRGSLPETVPGGAPWIGAIVDLDGGGASVEEQVSGPLGVVATACATSGSAQWYFAAGATLVNASVELSLLNPNPEGAIVDLSFSTEQGVEQPGDFQGIAVPAGGLVTVDVGSHLRRRQHIATTVSVRSGRVVAWKTDVVTPPAPGQAVLGGPASTSGSNADPAAPVAGVTLVLGAPSAARGWWWPEGLAGGGVDESYVIYNPGVATAQVRLQLILDQGSADPFQVSVAPGGVSTVVASQAARVPAGVGHAAIVQSLNGVPVVAERTVAAAKPSARVGLGELLGGRLAATGWLLGAGATVLSTDEWVAVFNPGPAAITVTVTRLEGGSATPVTGLTAVRVAPGRRLVAEVKPQSSPVEAGLLLRASGPAFVERDLYASIGGQPTFALALGVPLSSLDSP